MAIVSYEKTEQIAYLTISRPERRNALNHDGVAQLRASVQAARADSVRALIIRGSDGHFCAGADLKELEDLTFTRALRKTLDELADTPFPTIAAISGSCMGLGAQIALACDLRLAASDAKFAVPVAKLGLMVDHWTLQRLSLLVGHSMARWMTLTAQPIDASQAAAVGFVHQIAAPGAASSTDQVYSEAHELARQISRLAPLSLAGTKLGLNQLERGAEALDPNGQYRNAFEAAWASQDLIEGRNAFVDRRQPQFQGK
jgi:enoyl-CoA hydratase